MALTHHPVRLFRLSCGCLRGYPMMPAGTEHAVLCTRCGVPAVTVTAYPERCCGTLGWAVVSGKRVAVACTLAPGSCTANEHADVYIQVQFTVTVPRLAAAREGRTLRA